MKSYIIVAALSVLTGGLSAQTSIEDVLRSVEANNKDLQANSQLVQSQKLEAVGRLAGGILVVPPEAIVAERLEVLVLRRAEAGRLGLGHQLVLSTGCGMCVVHTPSPWAIVASRCT